MQLYADWLITKEHLTFSALSVLFASSEERRAAGSTKRRPPAIPAALD
jgi:hypothetical protein